MHTRRRLSLSSAAPPTRPQMNCGTAQMMASEPAASASPVRASSTSGSTTPAMLLPSNDSASLIRNRRTEPFSFIYAPFVVVINEVHYKL